MSKASHIHHHHLATRRWFFIGVSAVIFYLFWQIISPFIIILLTAAVAGVVLAPIASRIEKQIKSSRIVALLLVFLTIIAVFIPLFFIGLALVQEANDLISSSSEAAWLTAFDASELPFFDTLPQNAQDRILAFDLAELGPMLGNWIIDNIEPIFSSILSIFFGTGLFLISTYFFLVERKRIKKEMLELSPFNDKLDQKIVRRIVDAMRGVVFGALIVALLQGIFATIGFTIFGVPSPVLWGTIVMIAAQVPMIGASLVMIPAIAFLLISGKTAAAIGMGIWAIVVVGMIDNIISPYLIEGRTKMHALLILLSILGGLRFFGPIGFIIGPTVLAAVMAIIELYKSGVWEQG